MQGIQHTIECHCILPQFRSRKNPPYHQFIVFSIIDKGDVVIPKQAACNNCGVIHNVYDISKSEIIPGQETGAIMGKEDIQLMLPDSITNILSSYNCNLATWEQTLFIFQNQEYPFDNILSKETEDNLISGKYLAISGPGKYQIKPYSRRNFL